MKSDPRQALSDMVYGLRDVFKKYDRGARKKAWDSLQHGDGKKHMNGLIDNPSKPIVGVYKWLSFREWLEANDSLNIIGDEGKCDNCGRCCTAVSIHSKLPGGEIFHKDAGVKCPHLTKDNLCGIWGDTENQPEVCRNIVPNNDLCRYDLRPDPNGAKKHYQHLMRMDRATRPKQ